MPDDVIEKPSRALKLIETIEHDLTFGWIWCQTAIRYTQAFAKNGDLAYGWLHWGCFLACQREAVMALARMTDNAESLSLEKLLNYSEQNPAEYQHATKEQVRKQVVQHRKWLTEHDIFATVRTLRDKLLAHTDSIRLTNPSSLQQYNVDLTQTENCLREIHSVTEVYRGFYNDSSYSLDSIAEEIEREMQYELDLREAVTQRRLEKLERIRQSVKTKISEPQEKNSFSDPESARQIWIEIEE